MFKRKKGLIIIGVVFSMFVGIVFFGLNEKRITSSAVAATAAQFEMDHNLIVPQTGQNIAGALSEAFETATAIVSPSVVPIFAEQIVEVTSPFASSDPFGQFFGDDFFRRFFGTPQSNDQKQIVRGLGSGVIVTQDGYILTNNHVVDGADKLTVVLQDETKYEARVIGTDPQTDVALVKIDAKELPAARMGNSDEVKVGQWVIAVGNPFELLHTVTAGIISAKGRSSVGLADYEDFIQTDASINPGNSGGALADLSGNIIGINTAIESPTGSSVGIGFAIPINMAKQVMDDLLEDGKVSRGYLALVPQPIDENLAKALNLENTEGTLVGDVTPGGPADKAGILRGDVIVEFNGQKIKDDMELRTIVAQTKPGTSVKIGIVRDNKNRELTAVLGERPNQQEQNDTQQEQSGNQNVPTLGLLVQELTPALARQLGYDHEKGVLVANVIGGSPADEVGLQRGDLIKEVNRQEITAVQEFQTSISKLESGDSVALLVMRGQNTFYVAVQIP